MAKDITKSDWWAITSAMYVVNQFHEIGFYTFSKWSGEYNMIVADREWVQNWFDEMNDLYGEDSELWKVNSQN